MYIHKCGRPELNRCLEVYRHYASLWQDKKKPHRPRSPSLYDDASDHHWNQSQVPTPIRSTSAPKAYQAGWFDSSGTLRTQHCISCDMTRSGLSIGKSIHVKCKNLPPVRHSVKQSAFFLKRIPIPRIVRVPLRVFFESALTFFARWSARSSSHGNSAPEAFSVECLNSRPVSVGWLGNSLLVIAADQLLASFKSWVVSLKLHAMVWPLG